MEDFKAANISDLQSPSILRGSFTLEACIINEYINEINKSLSNDNTRLRMGEEEESSLILWRSTLVFQRDRNHPFFGLFI